MTQALTVQSWNLRRRELTPAQLTLLQNSVAKGSSPDEFNYFLAVCDATDLSPLRREIYAIMRKQNGIPVMVIQTAIDGYRKIAQVDSSDAPEFGPEDANGHPEWCKLNVYKQGQRFQGYCRYKEFAQDSNPMWNKMPYNQLAKCTEAQALRKAAPQALAGVEFSSEEPPAIEVLESPRVTVNSLTQGNPPAREATVRQQAPSGLGDDSVMVVCPLDGASWQSKTFGSKVVFSHPTAEKDPGDPEGKKNLWHQRTKVLTNMMVRAREAAGIPDEDAVAFIKDRYGCTLSQLTDEQRLEVVGLFGPHIEAPPAGPGDATEDASEPV